MATFAFCEACSHLCMQRFPSHLWCSLEIDSASLSGNMGLGLVCGKGEIIVFNRENYEGDSQKFGKDHSSLKKDGWNDRIASFQVGPKTEVTFYEHEDYNGKSKNFNKNHSDLKEYGLHKKISAFKITTN